MNTDTATAAQQKRFRPAELMPTVHSQLTHNGPILRVIAAMLFGALGYLAITHTAAYQMRSQYAGFAHSLSPYDGRITALAAAYRSGPEASSADRRAGDALARLALRQDPTAVIAASTIGLNAQVRDRVPEARRLFAYAGFLSRREMQTQLWAIEDAVGRGSVVDALRHYDIAMRSTPTLFPMLFPPLASASTDPAIRVPLVKILAQNPPWGPGFISYVASYTLDPKSTSQFFKDLNEINFRISDDNRAIIIRNLIINGYIEEAWNYYSTLYPGSDRMRSRDPRFIGTMNPPSMLDWVISTDDGVSATVQRGVNHGILDFASPSMIGGTIAEQVQVFPAGTYRLSGHSFGIEQKPGDGPYWSLRCPGGKELSRIDIPNSAEGSGNFFGTFDVPTGCLMQTLSLVARPSESIAGLSGQIDFLQVGPIDSVSAQLK